jgi:UDP-N-acetylmuramate: L-alanyl-gamma-D-glutamyl-meso-diaminopimelate ligase
LLGCGNGLRAAGGPAMKIHILGICGTFMGGIARLARELGHEVSGSDANTYPPMSTQLGDLGIPLTQGYAAEFLQTRPDLVLVGNALSRGNPAVEALLDSDVPYTSGPQWLREAVLEHRWVVAVAGTHGKTTVTSLIAWMLESAGLQPGFLVGGVPLNFGVSARLGTAPFFVVEADEYDTAFFDKRAKFVHYRPRTLVINNIEYDHADIYPGLADIRRQFHHLVRVVPGGGLIVYDAADGEIARVLEQGCWSALHGFAVGRAADWQADASMGQELRVIDPQGRRHNARTPLLGEHNLRNTLAAVAAACHAGVPVARSLEALRSFRSVARRLQVLAQRGGVTVYDDFAHHPTAIRATLQALRAQAGAGRVIAVLEPRSNTMRSGVHGAALCEALETADLVYLWHRKDLKFDPARALQGLGSRVFVSESVDSIAKSLIPALQNGDHVVLMSNGSFGGLHDKFVTGID